MRSEKLVFPNGRGQDLAARLELPDGDPTAWVIFAHCFTCSKETAAASRVSRELARAGFGVLRFDFTGLGGSEGDFANTDFSSNVRDLVAAADHLREHHGAPALLVGHSLGGAAVIAAAPEIAEVRAVATIGAPSDPGHVQHLFDGDLEAIEQEGSADVTLAGRTFRISKGFVDDVREQRLTDVLSKLGRALLIFHSPEDGIVPIDNAAKLFAAARHPKSFVSVDGADHMLARREDAAFVASTLASWARRYVGPRADVVEEEQREDPVRPGHVIVREEAGLRQVVRTDRHRWTADEPADVGGTDAGPKPSELLLSALGACTSMTLRMYANHKGWPVESIVVGLAQEVVSKNPRRERIERVVNVTGELSDEQRARLLEIANKCPVHRTLTGELEIDTRLA